MSKKLVVGDINDVVRDNLVAIYTSRHFGLAEDGAKRAICELMSMHSKSTSIRNFMAHLDNFMMNNSDVLTDYATEDDKKLNSAYAQKRLMSMDDCILEAFKKKGSA